jgi:hypothetical protein
MRKKTTTGLVIATILIAYISTFTLSNQAFAQPGGQVLTGRPLLAQEGKALGEVEMPVGKVLAGEDAQAGKVLAGHEAQLGQSEVMSFFLREFDSR